MFYFLRLACAFQLRICILLAWESLFLHEIIVRDAVENYLFPFASFGCGVFGMFPDSQFGVQFFLFLFLAVAFWTASLFL